MLNSDLPPTFHWIQFVIIHVQPSLLPVKLPKKYLPVSSTQAQFSQAGRSHPVLFKSRFFYDVYLEGTKDKDMTTMTMQVLWPTSLLTSNWHFFPISSFEMHSLHKRPGWFKALLPQDDCLLLQASWQNIRALRPALMQHQQNNSNPKTNFLETHPAFIKNLHVKRHRTMDWRKQMKKNRNSVSELKKCSAWHLFRHCHTH